MTNAVTPLLASATVSGESGRWNLSLLPAYLDLLATIGQDGPIDARQLAVAHGFSFSTTCRYLDVLRKHGLAIQRWMANARGSNRAFYVLAQGGYELLKTHRRQVGIRRERIGMIPSLTTLQHHRKVIDLKTAFLRALSTHGAVEYARFEREPRYGRLQVSLKGREEQAALSPDGRLEIVLKSGGQISHIVELDRSTVPGTRIRARLAGWVAAFQTGHIARHFLGADAKAEDFPFKILFVCETRERLANLLTIAAELGIRRMVQGALFQQAVVSPLSPIWIAAEDVASGNADGRMLLEDTDS